MNSISYSKEFSNEIELDTKFYNPEKWGVKFCTEVDILYALGKLPWIPDFHTVLV